MYRNHRIHGVTPSNYVVIENCCCQLLWDEAQPCCLFCLRSSSCFCLRNNCLAFSDCLHAACGWHHACNMLFCAFDRYDKDSGVPRISQQGMEEEQVLQGPETQSAPLSSAVQTCLAVTNAKPYEPVPRPKKEGKGCPKFGLHLNWRNGHEWWYVIVVSVFVMVRQEDYRIQEFKTSQWNIAWLISRERQREEWGVGMHVWAGIPPFACIPPTHLLWSQRLYSLRFIILPGYWFACLFVFTKAHTLILSYYLLRSLSIY